MSCGEIKQSIPYAWAREQRAAHVLNWHPQIADNRAPLQSVTGLAFHQRCALINMDRAVVDENVPGLPTGLLPAGHARILES